MVSRTRLSFLGSSLLMMAIAQAFRVSVVQAARPTYTLERAEKLIDPLSRLLQDLDESVFPLWRQACTMTPKNAMATFTVDIVENPTAYVINADLPGVLKEDIKVTCEGGILAIQAERKDILKQPSTEDSATASTPTTATSNEARLVSEVVYGKLHRSFKLPPNADPERVEAKFDHRGVLVVTLPKAEPPKEKVIEIKEDSIRAA